jgi:small subunit ribosomal protein S4e
MIVMRRCVTVDGKVRTDLNYPAGFMDVVTIPKTDEIFRLLYDIKGRFALHRITKQEAAYKLCRIQKRAKANKASIGRNPFQTGQQASIPYAVTHDGRTLRFIDPLIKVNDTVKIDIETGKVAGHIKFDVGNMCMITKGANVGRVGTIVAKDRHPGSFDIVHIRDRKGNEFATRIGNVFIIGEGNSPSVSLPKNKGVKKTILEEMSENQAKKEKKE